VTVHRSAFGPGHCLVCPAAPVVMVADPQGDEAPMCREHWHEALRRSDGLIRAIRLYRPDIDAQQEGNK
jgi:hypothetical protein